MRTREENAAARIAFSYVSVVQSSFRFLLCVSIIRHDISFLLLYCIGVQLSVCMHLVLACSVLLRVCFIVFILFFHNDDGGGDYDDGCGGVDGGCDVDDGDEDDRDDEDSDDEGVDGGDVIMMAMMMMTTMMMDVMMTMDVLIAIMITLNRGR